MIEKFARFISQFPGRAAIVLTILTGFFASQLLNLKIDFTPQAIFSQKTSDYEFYSSFTDEFGTDDSFIIFLIQGGDIFTPRGIALLKELTSELEALPGLQNTRSLTNIPEIHPLGEEGFSVVSFLDPPPQTDQDYQHIRKRVLQSSLYQQLYISPDGKTASVITQLIDEIKNIKQMEAVVDAAEDIVADKFEEYPDFKIILGGIPFVRVDIVRALFMDQLRFMPPCMIIIIIISYLTFRNIQGVVLPFLTVLVIAIWGVGIMHLCGGEINVLTNSLPIIVMIIGVADAIHLLTRYEEETQRGEIRKKAIYHSVRNIGIACMLTSFTTAVAFASLGLSTNRLLSRFGIYASLAILAAYIVTITMLPILLARWGRTTAPNNTNPKRTDRWDKILDTCADICVSQPWSLFLAGLAVVIFSFFGALRTEIGNNIFEFTKEDSEIYQNNLAIEESLAGIIPYSISFHGETDLFKDPDFLNRISLLQQALIKDPIVGKTLSLNDFVEQMHRAFHGDSKLRSEKPLSSEAIAQYLLLFSLSGNDEDLERLVNQDYSWGSIHVRCKATDSDIITAHLDNVNRLILDIFPEKNNHLQITLTGTAVFAYSTIDDLLQDMIKSIFMACAIIFLVITLEFRSLRIGLISIIPNLIPVLLTYGAMGWLGIKLQMMTVIVFTISLGIAVDDSIHFLVRFREEFRKHGDYEKAIRSAFRGAGRAICYTTVILVLGFMALTLSSMPPMAMFAYLSAITMTSALLADLFVLPACILIFKPKP